MHSCDVVWFSSALFEDELHNGDLRRSRRRRKSSKKSPSSSPSKHYASTVTNESVSVLRRSRRRRKSSKKSPSSSPSKHYTSTVTNESGSVLRRSRRRRKSSKKSPSSRLLLLLFEDELHNGDLRRSRRRRKSSKKSPSSSPSKHYASVNKTLTLSLFNSVSVFCSLSALFFQKKASSSLYCLCLSVWLSVRRFIWHSQTVRVLYV